jgi:hypothetical protein
MSEQVYILYFNINDHNDLVNLNNILAQGYRVKSSTPLPDVRDPNNNQNVSRIMFILEEAS